MDQYSEAEVREALEPYHRRIRAIIKGGLDEWLSVAECRSSKGFAPPLYQRTVSNYIFDAVARNARTVFGEDPSVRVLDEAQTVKFCFSNVVIGRFKKGDDDHLGQNIRTQAVLDFICVEPNLPGLPPEAAKVEFTWSLDELGVMLDSVTVVARDGDHILWSYEISDAEESGGAVVLFPTPPDEPDDEEPLVRPKIAPRRDIEGE
ncbi:MAG: hypothetical protein H6873_11355 [Hyphomicrobiaceae bacterium]|nr:hypothetical protein [Hyphomicrobiaceae bacterium]